MKRHAVVLAGGTGERFGDRVPKQFARLAGVPILTRTVRAIARLPALERVVVVGHPDWLDETRARVGGITGPPIVVVAGGDTRNASTAAGLAALSAADDDTVLVHDAVRPFVSVDVMARACLPVEQGEADAVDTVIAARDTVVEVDNDDLVGIPDRSRLRRGQTPQVFRYSVLRAAYDEACLVGDLSATDDCAVVFRYVPGARIKVVEGSEENVKVTMSFDLVIADRILQLSVVSGMRRMRGGRRLRDRRILIVGGTSGIGLKIASRLRRLGARVVSSSRVTGLDVRRMATVDRLIRAASTDLGGLDDVVVTAGVLAVGPLMQTSRAALLDQVNTNFVGALNVALAAHKLLAASSGSLTLFGSTSFSRGRPDQAVYSATKAAVVNLAQALADEWEDHGIRVNVINPERAQTPMRHRAFPNESKADQMDPSRIADVTVNLLRSDLTGQVIDIRAVDR